MVGMMSSSSRERLARLLSSAKSATDIPSKLENLRRLKRSLLEEDGAVSISYCLPLLFELQADRHSPVRKFVAEILGEIGLNHLEFVPEIVHVLCGVLEDQTPAVARQAITCGINLFRSTLEKIAIKGLSTSGLDDIFKLSWSSMLEFKERIYSIAFQPGGGGVRLLALKFVEAVILLYMPDPYGSTEPPSHEGEIAQFNVSWLRGGHPLLNVGDLSIEASKRLGLLLDQLRSPTVKSLSNLVIIVLINGLAKIAKERPAYYGRILPVLLGLGPSSSVIEGMHVPGTHHALKNAFITCLKCSHPGAAPWRVRLVDALKEMKPEGFAEESLHRIIKRNENVDEAKQDLLADEEVHPSVRAEDSIDNRLGRKRSGTEGSNDLADDDDFSGKRVRLTPSVSEESTKESSRNVAVSQDDISSDGPPTNRQIDDSGPVQQLVAMFGALVAQGEKAVGSLEILISSISADLLAEVVMANMRHLSSSHPQAEGSDESLVNMTIVGSDSQAKYPPSFLADVLSLPSSFPPIVSRLNAPQSVSGNLAALQGEEDLHMANLVDGGAVNGGISHVAEIEILHDGLPASSNVDESQVEMDDLAIPSDAHDVGNLESEIPGLDSSAGKDGFSDNVVGSSMVSTDLEDASQDQVTSLGERSMLDLLPSISTDQSEELSPKAAVTDSSSMISSTATSVSLPPFVLPKMSAPVVDLTAVQKDQLQNWAFMRIVEAYKQIAVPGGSQVRLSLLAHLGVEFPSELDQWKLLKEYILSDYLNHEGHELTLHVLYRLYGEVEEEQDFFSSTTAASVYETFLLTVAETLKDSFPPSDKSLSRLLGEAPYLPKSLLNLLESLCSPGDFDKAEKEAQIGDRVTQGLSTIWNLILLRPTMREVCLKIALQSAVHHLEEVRMKAIRLVANKLYALSSIAQQIENFAKEMLLSAVSIDAEGSVAELEKDDNLEKPSNELQSVSATSKDTSSDAHQVFASETVSSLSVAEAQRCMSLYFALCTKKHSLLLQIFVIYKSSSKAVKQAIHRHIPILVRTTGSSPELLEIISDPPSGSKDLLMQVLQTLTNGTVPPPELLFTVKKLYDSKLKDVEIIIPLLPFLPKDEVLLIFPHLMNLSPDKFQVALSRILQCYKLSKLSVILDDDFIALWWCKRKGSSQFSLSPTEVLIAIHGVDPDRDGIPLKKVTDACNACFEQRYIFTQQVLAKVLNQLVEQTPLPLLFMRTVLQAIGAFPALMEFIMEILSRLVSKQIWKYPKLWVGFLKCAFLTKPQSFGVLLQLPPPQLENALNRTPALKAPLVAHASQSNIKSSLPRSVLVVLGIATDSQASSQAQGSQAQTGDTGNSDKDLQTDKAKESSSAS